MALTNNSKQRYILLINIDKLPSHLQKLINTHNIPVRKLIIKDSSSYTEFRYLLENALLVLHKPSINIKLQLAIFSANIAGIPSLNINNKDAYKLLESHLEHIQTTKTIKFKTNTYTYNNELKIHYLTLGNKNNPKLVFFHGIGSVAITYLRLLEFLSKKYFVIAPDIPYFGKSDTPKKSITTKSKVFNFKDFAIVFESFIKDTIKNQKVTIAGHSFGGAVATSVAYYSRLPIKKLILFNPAGAKNNSTVQATLGNYIKVNIPNKFKNERQVISDVILNLLKLVNGIPSLKNTIKIINLTLKGIKDLKPHCITVPTTIFWAKNDEILPDSYKIRHAELFSCPYINIIPGYHNSLIKRPEILKPFDF